MSIQQGRDKASAGLETEESSGPSKARKACGKPWHSPLIIQIVHAPRQSCGFGG